MRVVNHQSCNFDLYTLRLEPGENIVDDELWRKLFAQLPDKLKQAYFGSKTPRISIAGDAGEQLAMGLTQSEETEQLSAREKIQQINDATEPDRLEALAQGETRKTVMAAISRRARQLADEVEVEDE